MKWILALVVFMACGCCCTNQHKTQCQWSAGADAKTIILPYNPHVVEKVEVGVNIKRTW